MGKNIIIFSDGTGNRGGLLVDERRSNVYKLFRATRPGPDSYVDAIQQVAFYDPGLGTLPAGLDSAGSIARAVYNAASQATGLGLTGNIIDCYAEIVRLYRPGDRIYLFGFSRGAYTVRCVAGVLRWCGIPTRTSDGEMKFDEKSSRKIAREAVKKVYQHATSKPEHAGAKPEDRPSARERIWLQQRRDLAARFREKYGSDANGQANVVPYFLGIYDTVASLANPVVSVLFSIGFLGALAAASWLIALIFSTSTIWIATLLVGAGALWGAYKILTSHIKVAFGFDNGEFWYLKGYSFWHLIHFTDWRMKFYDRQVNADIEYVRHAISVDENRKSFPREPIDQPVQWPSRRRPCGDWLVQQWFAGNHSDVGGSYAENESRLSDISLGWMSAEAEKTGLLIDRRLLQLYPSPDGMQHDEFKNSLFRYFGKKDRDPPKDAPLHPTILKRFEETDILQCDVRRPYRPDCLRHNIHVSHFWDADELERYFVARAREEAMHRVSASQAGTHQGHDAEYWQRVADEIARRDRARAKQSHP